LSKVLFKKHRLIYDLLFPKLSILCTHSYIKSEWLCKEDSCEEIVFALYSFDLALIVRGTSGKDIHPILFDPTFCSKILILISSPLLCLSGSGRDLVMHQIIQTEENKGEDGTKSISSSLNGTYNPRLILRESKGCFHWNVFLYSQTINLPTFFRLIISCTSIFSQYLFNVLSEICFPLEFVDQARAL